MEISFPIPVNYNQSVAITNIQSQRKGRLLEDVAGMYSSVFGTKAGPNR